MAIEDRFRQKIIDDTIAKLKIVLEQKFANKCNVVLSKENNVILQLDPPAGNLMFNIEDAYKIADLIKAKADEAKELKDNPQVFIPESVIK